MESHIMSWNGFIGVICAAVILYLGDLLIRYRRRCAQLREQLTETEQQLTIARAEQAQAVVESEADNHPDPVHLPTFKIFQDRLVQMLNQSERHQLVFAVMLLDIDDFNVMNNVLGFEAGDLLLQEIVQRLHSCIRKVDTMARVSNDSFILLLPQLTKAETAAYVAQRLLDAISQPFKILNHELFVTASIGITIYPSDGSETERLLKNADIALQQAKSRGHDVYQFYHEDLYIASHRELRLNSGLRSDSIYQEFTLYYQPILNVAKREIVSMEALLRWRHPELGLVAPQDFLRLAENNGRIVAIGEWVLRRACEQFKKWQSQGVKLQSISVNVSLRQLENTDFSYHVSQILHELAVEPASLILEISENVLLPKLALVEKTLHMLKHLGVQIAIDDFGTGYLSLQHLRRFPVACLKIDTSLVQDMFLNHESGTIVKTIVDLANSLQLAITAEGVENEKQHHQLQEYGCDIMQGYLFSHPRLPEEFTREVLDSITEKVKT
jgi:diguanylate cyclase (GGDEF)-like protein